MQTLVGLLLLLEKEVNMRACCDFQKEPVLILRFLLCGCLVAIGYSMYNACTTIAVIIYYLVSCFIILVLLYMLLLLNKWFFIIREENMSLLLPLPTRAIVAI